MDTYKNEFLPTEEPEYVVASKGNEKVEQVRPKKKILVSKQDQEKEAKSVEK